MSDKTRYTIIGVGSILFLALIIVVIVLGNNVGEKLKEGPSDEPESNISSNSGSNSTSPTERNESTEALKDFYKEFDSKELNVIFFQSSTCGYCQLQKPIIKQISGDYDMEYYEIDASKLTNTEISEIVSALDISGATPTTVIVKEGKVIDSNEGYLDGKPFVEFFVKNGVLDKGATYKPEDKLVEIDYDEFKKISKKDSYQLIYLDTSACESCIEARSILNDLADDNDFEVNYLGANSLTQADVNNLVETDLKEMEYDEETYKEKQQIKIPLLLIIKDNKIQDYVLESTEESDYTKVLKKYGFIK